MTTIDEQQEIHEQELQDKRESINKLFIGTFGTELGQRCLKHLGKTFIDREIYQVGMSFEQTAFRQGQASVIRDIIKTLEANNG